MMYIHGSAKALPIGTRLVSQNVLRLDSCIEVILERLRPDGKPGRAASVFMAKDIDTLESMGMGDAFFHEVVPEGKVHSMDVGWLERAQVIHDEARGMLGDRDESKIATCAKAYWSEKRLPHDADESSHLEYLCETCTVTGYLFNAADLKADDWAGAVGSDETLPSP